MTEFVDSISLLDSSLDSDSAAECHGTLTGLACGGGLTADRDWSAALPASDDAGEMMHAVSALGDKTVRELSADMMGFAPLLPDDVEPVDVRAAALHLWCRGFLYGFGLAFSGDEAALSDDLREVLQDFSEIARMELDTEGSEADEEAFTEIVEYIRVGVQLVFDTLHPAQGSTPPVVH